MKKLIILSMFAALTSAGCAIIGGGQDVNNPENPDQGRTWTIWGSNEEWAFNNADKKCPYGYYVHRELPNTFFPPLHLLEIECKPESSGLVDLVLRPVEEKPYNPDGIGLTGEYSFQIEQMSDVRICNAHPYAILESKQRDIQTYSVACTNGTTLKFTCQLGNCYRIRN